MVDEPCYVFNLHISEVLLMEWIDEMKTAMKVMKEACRKASLNDCKRCPFDSYCDLMTKDDLREIPEGWKIDD